MAHLLADMYLRCHMLLALVPPIIVFCLLISLANSSSSFENISFSFPHFDSNEHRIFLRGDASLMSPVVQLTTNVRDKDLSHSKGHATYYTPLHLWDNATGNMASFSTQFTFVMNSQGINLHGDGLAFFLTPAESQIPDRSDGGCLALLSCDTWSSSGMTSVFVAVEIDTFNDIWDPPCQHIGIDLNNIKSAVNACVPWLEASVWNGKELQAKVTYNSSTHNLSVVLEDVNDPSSGRNASSLYSIVNLKDYLPEQVMFGFSASTGGLIELHTLQTWEFNSSLEVSPTSVIGQKGNHARLLATLGGLALIIITLVSAWLCCLLRRHQNYRSTGAKEEIIFDSKEIATVASPSKFPYKELAAGTNDFADDRLLGEGGFGRVYEGYLRDGNHVAIKKINPESKQGMKEYVSEVKIISQLRHRNLVQLIGWCHENNEFILIYEFMSQGSLDLHLFKGKTLLLWDVRYKIAQGIASALLYLHDECEQCVVHRDIKSSNVMLDEKFNAKLGDFGLARLVEHEKGARTTALAGTMGYMAPECIRTGKASKESDIYSFGIVLLELACGRKVTDSTHLPEYQGLVEWVWEHYGTGKLLEVLDPKLGGSFDEKQVQCLMILGIWCAHPDYRIRPSIGDAMNLLSGNILPPELPQKMPIPTYLVPTFGTSTSSLFSSSLTATDPHQSISIVHPNTR